MDLRTASLVLLPGSLRCKSFYCKFVSTRISHVDMFLWMCKCVCVCVRCIFATHKLYSAMTCHPSNWSARVRCSSLGFNSMILQDVSLINPSMIRKSGTSRGLGAGLNRIIPSRWPMPTVLPGASQNRLWHRATRRARCAARRVAVRVALPPSQTAESHGTAEAQFYMILGVLRVSLNTTIQ